MAEIADLMTANLLEVFGQRDPTLRRAAIERTYTPDVIFHDPEEVVVGWDALDAKAQQILDGGPDFVFSPAGPVGVNDDLGHLAWNLGPAGAEPIVSGIDIALVRDGLIASLYTLLLTPG